MSENKYVHGTHPEEQQRLSALNQLLNTSFLSFLHLNGAKSILEVGSGLGILTQEVALRLPDAEVVGVEHSTEQLGKVQCRLPNVRFLQGDAHHLEFDDNRFDVVYARWVLEHVSQPQRVLEEMRRVTRPGGHVFLEENDIAVQRYDPPVPKFESIWNQFGILQERLGGDSLIGRRLFRLLKSAGWDDIQLSVGNDVYWSGHPGFRVWVENELSIIESSASDLVSHGLATQAEIEGALSELRGLLERNDAASWFYWNRAIARK